MSDSGSRPPAGSANWSATTGSTDPATLRVDSARAPRVFSACSLCSFDLSGAFRDPSESEDSRS